MRKCKLALALVQPSWGSRSGAAGSGKRNFWRRRANRGEAAALPQAQQKDPAMTIIRAAALAAVLASASFAGPVLAQATDPASPSSPPASDAGSTAPTGADL